MLKIIRKDENKLPLALAAYNAGLTTVDTHQAVPPYYETKDYMENVMKACNI